MKAILETIIQERIPCYFISPHLDDAALSCGGLINFLAGKTDMTVVSAFTAISSPPHTLSAKAFLRQCQSADAEKLFADRKSEDAKVLGAIGVKTEYWDFIDAQWRKKGQQNWLEKITGKILPEFSHIYPTYRWHVVVGKISRRDDDLKDSIKKYLAYIMNAQEKFFIFCPLGTGKHVDHLIVRNCCLEASGDSLILWSDFPYNKNSRPDFPELGNYKEENFVYDREKKAKLIEAYATQYKALFPGGKADLSDEIYYIKK